MPDMMPPPPGPPEKIERPPRTQVVPHPDHPRIEPDPEALRLLADDIAVRGINTPLRVYPLADGKFQLISGHRRLKAAQLLGLATVPVTVEEPLTPSEFLAHTVLDAEAAVPLTLIEKAEVMQRLLQLNPGWTYKELAKALHTSPAVCSKTLTVKQALHPDLIPLVVSGKIGGRSAYLIAAQRDMTRQKDLGLAVAEGRLTGPELIALLDSERRAGRGRKPFHVPLPVDLDATWEAALAVVDAFRGRLVRFSKSGAPLKALRTLILKE